MNGTICSEINIKGILLTPSNKKECHYCFISENGDKKYYKDNNINGFKLDDSLMVDLYKSLVSKKLFRIHEYMFSFFGYHNGVLRRSLPIEVLHGLEDIKCTVYTSCDNLSMNGNDYGIYKLKPSNNRFLRFATLEYYRDGYNFALVDCIVHILSQTYGDKVFFFLHELEGKVGIKTISKGCDIMFHCKNNNLIIYLGNGAIVENVDLESLWDNYVKGSEDV